MKRYKGFGIIEIIVAMAIMLILVVTGTTMIIQTFTTNRLSEETTKAHLYAQEGIEAIKSIKKQGWNNLSVGGTTCDSSKLGGVAIDTNLWTWTGTNNIDGKYTRSIEIQNVCKDINGEIVLTGGTVDPNIKRIVSKVNWDFTPSRQNESKLVTYLTNWGEELVTSQCDWSTIHLASTYNTTGNEDILDLKYVNPFLFSGSNEFNSFDTSDIQNLIVNGIDLTLTINGLDTYNDLAYLATNSDTEIRIIDISDPYNPILTNASIDLTGTSDALKISVDVNYIYITRETANKTGEFLIYDRLTLTLKDDYEISKDVNNLFIDGNYAYLATSSNTEELIELDISDPNNIQLIGVYDTQDGPNAQSVFFDGNYIYLSTSNNTGSHNNLDDAEVYILHTNHTSPSPITLISQFDIGDDVYDIQAYNNKIFLGNDVTGKEITILDSTDINNLIELTSLDISGRVYAIDTDIHNCRIYAGSINDDSEINIIETGTGSGGSGGGIPTTTEAESALADTSLTIITGPGDKNLENISLDNTGVDPITVTHMRVTWIDGQKEPSILNEILIDNISVFNTSSTSGDLIDITDIIILPSVPINISPIRFNSDSSGATYTIEFHMSDLSIYTISNITPADG